MRIKATQLLTAEDFPDQQGWIGKLIQPLNQFIGDAIRILNDGAQFPDNFLGKEHIFSFTYQTDALSFPIGFQWPLAALPKSLQVASATEDGIAFIPALSWTYTTTGQVQLTSVLRLTNAPAVALLQAGKKYQIRTRITP